jgi:hypothetical protein
MYIISHPMEALVFTSIPADKIFYMLSLLAPFMMLPIITLELLPVLSWLTAALLSDYGPYYSIYFQYSAFIIGQIFVAAIFGIKKLLSSRNSGQGALKLQRRIITLVLFANLFLSIMISPAGLPALGERRVAMTRHTELLSNILRLVPDNASIATQNDIFPHVAQREDAYILTWPMVIRVDFILVDIKSNHFLVGFPTTPTPAEALETTIKIGKYGLFASADGILLFKKDYDKPVGLFVPYETVFSSDTPFTFHLLPVNRASKVVVDSTSSSRRIIVHEPQMLTNLTWLGPYAYTYTGDYTAVFKIKTRSENLNLTIDVAADLGRVICQRSLNYSDFKAFDTWQEFTLNFRTDGLKQLEFRGVCQSGGTYVALDYVQIVQRGP